MKDGRKYHLRATVSAFNQRNIPDYTTKQLRLAEHIRDYLTMTEGGS